MKKLLILIILNPLFISAQLSSKSLITRRGIMGFYEFKPEGYNPDSTYNYPLIIFLHGVGERGNGTSELPLVLLQTFPKMLSKGATLKFNYEGKQHAFIVLMPQMSKDYENWQNFYIDTMISYAKKNLKIDEHKIFLSGWSLGGGGAWKYSTASLQNSNHIAGVILAAASPDYTNLCNLSKGNVAVWAFHARDDASVPIHFTEDAVEGINKCSPLIPPLMTYYKAGGHPFTADAVYDTLNSYQYPNIFQWMIGSSRDKRPAVNKSPVPNAGNDTTVLVPGHLMLNASASYDPNDVIVHYQWKLISGPPSPALCIVNPDFAVTRVSGYELGIYQFRLTVTDQFNVSRSDDVHVQIELPPGGKNASPVATAGSNVTTTSKIYFLHSDARDYDGKITKFKWRQVAGPVPVEIVSFNKLAEICNMTIDGSYKIELTVFDDQQPAGSGKDTMVIIKKPPNPSYHADWSQGSGLFKGKSVGIYFSMLNFFFTMSTALFWVDKRFRKMED